jgi:hypothetical protein
MPAGLNAANEQAVALVLEERIHFLDIPRMIEKVCDRHRADLSADPSLADVLAVDGWARLKQLVRDLGLEDPAREQGIVLCGKAECLRICAAGPILRQHVIGGVPIEDLVVARHQFDGRRQRSS